MILYITSHLYNDAISEVINENKLNVLNAIVEEKFSLSTYIKKQLDQFQSVNILIVELSCIVDSNEDLLIALNNIRLICSSTRVIIISHNKGIGDKLLSEIFCLGIYDIITFTDKDSLISELTVSITIGKSYKDSIVYKINDEKTNGPDLTKKIRTIEKVIIKNEVKQSISVSKALIGFVGAQERIGITHNCIISANFLKTRGYQVAIVEDSRNKRKCFQQIKDFYEVEDNEDFFSLNNIDYYKDFDLNQLFRIIAKNYNFIFLDLGTYDQVNLYDFNRCVMQFVVCGSKPWELESMNNIFSSATEDILKEYIYLFNFTDEKYKEELSQSMGELNKVFFSDYTPDAVNSVYFQDLDLIFKQYIPESIVNEYKERKNVINRLKDVFSKGEIFEKKKGNAV